MKRKSNQLQMFQITAGIEANIFQTPIQLNWGSSTWVRQLIHECVDFDISLRIPDTLHLILPRENDNYILQIFQNISQTKLSSNK